MEHQVKNSKEKITRTFLQTRSGFCNKLPTTAPDTRPSPFKLPDTDATEPATGRHHLVKSYTETSSSHTQQQADVTSSSHTQKPRRIIHSNRQTSPRRVIHRRPLVESYTSPDKLPDTDATEPATGRCHLVESYTSSSWPIIPN